MFNDIKKGKWWDKPLTLVTGCTEISTECAGCWERAVAQRTNKILGKKSRYLDLINDTGMWTGQVRVDYTKLQDPLNCKTPHVWAVWQDLFHPGVPLDCQKKTFAMFAQCKNQLFIICTKRHKSACDIITRIKHDMYTATAPDTLYGDYLGNVVFMVTAGTQESYDAALPSLIKTPLPYKALSIEPLLEDINLRFWEQASEHTAGGTGKIGDHINWVITGGETSNMFYRNPRPMQPLWAKHIQVQCALANVHYLHKHNGEYAFNEDTYRYDRVGKKKAGRMLFGEIHDGLPVEACRLVTR